jgi:hypothetical protein
MRLPIGRKPLVVGGLGAGIVVAAVMAFQGDSPAARTPAASNRVSQSRPAQAQGAMPVVDVKLELLTDSRASLAETERNPFRFQPRPAPAPPPSRQAAPVRPVTNAPPVPSGPPPPPPIALRFIGLLDAPTQAGRVALMSDGRGNVFYGKEGDIIEGRYRVLKIGAEAAELSYADGRGRQTIRLSGQ